MNYRFGIWGIIVSIGGALNAQETDSSWSRYQDDAPGPRLEMAVRRLAHAGVLLDLIAVMHIGDPAAYRALGKRCESYDAVLYEHAERPAQPKLPTLSKDGKSEKEPEEKPD